MLGHGSEEVSRLWVHVGLMFLSEPELNSDLEPRVEAEPKSETHSELEAEGFFNRLGKSMTKR